MKRIQRQRTKGWRMPEGAVYVGRSSRWQNPAKIGRWASVGDRWRRAERCTMSTFIRTRADAELFFRLAIKHGGLVVGLDDAGLTRIAVTLPSVEEIRTQLAGRDLACWCPLDEPCHADVLLRIANGGES